MKKIILIFVLILVSQSFIYSGQYFRQKLPNGLEIILLPQPKLPIISFQLAVKYGSVYENEDSAGLVFLTTNMLDEGTTRYNSVQLAEKIDFIGASLSTSCDNHFIYISMSILKKDFDYGMDILTDILYNPRFDEKEFKRIKKQTLNQIIQSRDDPESVFEEEFREVMYKNHPYHRPVNGYETTLVSINVNDCRKLYEQVSAPNISQIIMVGDFSETEMITQLEKYFGNWKQKSVSIPDIPKYTGPDTIFKKIIYKENLTQSYIKFGIAGINRNSSEYNAARVMNYIFGGGGFASRLMDVIRAKYGLVYNIGSYFSPAKYGGVFTAELQTKLDSQDTAIILMMSELQRIRAEKVTDTEVSDAVAYYAGSLPRYQETISQLSGLIFNCELYNLPEFYWQKDIENIKKLTAT